MTATKIGKFMLATPAGQVWQITTTRGVMLGTVEWHAPWRQFEFLPQFGTAFTHDCLTALGAFVRGLNESAKPKAGGS